MWIVAGVLLGAVVLAALVGFHAGPHAHVAAAVLGVLAAAWLLVMAATGRSAPLLWVLLGADAALSAGLGTMAWSGIRHRHAQGRYRVGRLEAAEGVAVTDLVPEGVVRVLGEDWSAVSVNGPVPAGTRVQVLKEGVRLEVWGERDKVDEVPAGAPPRSLDEPTPGARTPDPGTAGAVTLDSGTLDAGTPDSGTPDSQRVAAGSGDGRAPDAGVAKDRTSKTRATGARVVDTRMLDAGNDVGSKERST